MTNWLNELQSVSEQILQSPKTTAAVSVTTASLGLAGIADLANGVMYAGATLAGIISTLLLGRVHWAKYKNEVLQNRILRKQLEDLGEKVDP